jgi:hypothetical protein
MVRIKFLAKIGSKFIGTLMIMIGIVGCGETADQQMSEVADHVFSNGKIYTL